MTADGRTFAPYVDLAEAARLTMGNVLAGLGEAVPFRLLIMVATADPSELATVAAAARAACPGDPVVSIVGLVSLPFGIPVEIEAIGEFHGPP